MKQTVRDLFFEMAYPYWLDRDESQACGRIRADSQKQKSKAGKVTACAELVLGAGERTEEWF